MVFFPLRQIPLMGPHSLWKVPGGSGLAGAPRCPAGDARGLCPQHESWGSGQGEWHLFPQTAVWGMTANQRHVSQKDLQSKACVGEGGKGPGVCIQPGDAESQVGWDRVVEAQDEGVEGGLENPWGGVTCLFLF